MANTIALPDQVPRVRRGRSWRALLVRRVLLGILTLWLVTLVVFAATQALSGDAATALLRQTATPERLAAFREQLHLDEPVWRQYTAWLTGVVTGDAGESFATRQPVAQLLGGRLVNSVVLVAASAVVAVPLSIGLGLLSGLYRDRAVDHLTAVGSLLLAAIPEFVLAMGLVLLFATAVFQVYPAVTLLPPGEPIAAHPQFLVLPTATLILAVVPYMSRIMRASVIEVLESEYVRMARLKGMSRRVVLLRHVLPNAIVPSIQVTALQLAWLAGGVVVVEFVFRYPGVGQALVDAVANRDIPVVQAVTLLIGAAYVGLNLIADVLTILATPRLRTAER